MIYLVFSKVVGWMVLRTRSTTAKETEILVLRDQLARDPTRLRGQHTLEALLPRCSPDVKMP